MSEVLEHITSCEDVWPTLSCKAFILEWASLLESKVKDYKPRYTGILYVHELFVPVYVSHSILYICIIYTIKPKFCGHLTVAAHF